MYFVHLTLEVRQCVRDSSVQEGLLINISPVDIASLALVGAMHNTFFMNTKVHLNQGFQMRRLNDFGCFCRLEH